MVQRIIVSGHLKQLISKIRIILLFYFMLIELPPFSEDVIGRRSISKFFFSLVKYMIFLK